MSLVPRAVSRAVVVLTASLALALGAACGDGGGGDPADSAGGSTTVDADLVGEGRDLYEQTCAACHGIDLKGTATGPPFLDPIYAPNHHSDESFYVAVEGGVQPHHWDFGPMPAQPGVGEADVAAIVAYVRSRQAEAGITHDPSH